MPDLYIANPTRGEHDFSFTLAERKRAQRQVIGAGQQIVLKNLSPEDSSAIIDHHRSYGMMEVKEAQRSQKRASLIYSDREIKFEGIAGAVEHNLVLLDKLGQQLRTEAAVVADAAVQQTGPDSSILKSTDVEVVEVVNEKNPDQRINEKRKVEDKAGKTDRRGQYRPGT